jgi:ribonuclease BN (tRNA processing enzyme)
VQLTIIGCAGSFPGPDSPASCYLLEADGFRLLLDLGSGALGVLQRHAALGDIDAVCLSHLHADHCLDLCPYWVARTYAPAGAARRIPVYGPAGTARRLARAQGVGEDTDLTERFSFATLSPGSTEIGPFQVVTAHMNHPVETFGFRFSHRGRSLAYSADTGESDALVGLSRDADLLLCEASFLTGPGLPGDLHLTAAQAAGHAARAGAARLVLTHLVPWNDQRRTLEEACEVPFGGQVTLAASGSRWSV